jgi:hypothetical protein
VPYRSGHPSNHSHVFSSKTSVRSCSAINAGLDARRTRDEFDERCYESWGPNREEDDLPIGNAINSKVAVGRTLMMTLRTRKNSLISIALFALAGPALAQDAMKVTYVTPDALTWKDNPTLPKGAQTAVFVGDPTKAGLSTRLSPLRPAAR